VADPLRMRVRACLSYMGPEQLRALYRHLSGGKDREFRGFPGDCSGWVREAWLELWDVREGLFGVVADRASIAEGRSRRRWSITQQHHRRELIQRDALARAAYTEARDRDYRGLLAWVADPANGCSYSARQLADPRYARDWIDSLGRLEGAGAKESLWGLANGHEPPCRSAAWVPYLPPFRPD
jgi:hypothetical protein